MAAGIPFNSSAPSRKEKLNKQLLDLAAGPFNGYGYKHAEWAEFDKLLRAGADMNATNKDGDTVLNLVCAHGHRDAALNLLSRGCDFKKPNKDGMTPFLSAVQAGDPILVRALLVKGVPLDSRNANGQNALQVLTNFIRPSIDMTPEHKAQRCALLELLVGAGLPLNSYHENRIYRGMDYLLPAVPALQAVHALSRAAQACDHGTASALMASGVHPDAPAAYGDHAVLSTAAERGDLPMMEAALAAGADINLTAGNCKITALQRSVMAGRKESFTFLLSAGADPQIPHGPYTQDPLLKIAASHLKPTVSDFFSGALSQAAAFKAAAQAPAAETATLASKTAPSRLKISIHFSI